VGGPRNISALNPDGTLIKYVYNLSDLGPPGSADDALMAFQHRMCISEGEWMAPWPKPDGYNPDVCCASFSLPLPPFWGEEEEGGGVRSALSVRCE
jgi:hypothetical protein